MSSPRCLQLLLSCILLVLLVQFPQIQSRPATEDTDTALAPQWVRPERMERRPVAVPAGNTVKLRCEAIGNPVPSRSWYKNGEEISNVQRQGGFKIRNHTWALLIESVVPSDKGNYTCEVKNKHGSLKHSYHLEVLERRVHRSILANQTAVVGGDVTFVCGGFDDRQRDIQWLKHITINGNRVGPNGHPYLLVVKDVDWSTDEEMHVLTLRNVTLNDAGQYTCRVGSADGISYYSGWLTVINEPVVD